MAKTILSDENKAEIVNLYLTTVPSIHKLAEIFKVGHKKISEIIKDSSIEINKKGGQVKFGDTEQITKHKTILYKTEDINKEYVAICKSTGTILKDPNNFSGTLTNHLKKLNVKINIPKNTFQRKKYEISNNKKWFEEYFDIILIDKKNDIICCPICQWETNDVKNKSGAITKHITNEHNLTITEFVEKYPNFSDILTTKLTIENVLNSDEHSVKCLECGEKFIGLTETHMNSKHNMSLVQYKEKWGNEAKIFSNNSLEVMRLNAIEINKNSDYSFISKPQKEIAEYIENELNLTVKLSDKKTLKGTEVDILIPDLNIAIEYNGLYWHNEKMGKHKNYHLDKTIIGLKNNIKIIHIFEDEWNYNKEIVKNRLTNILGKSNKRLYARQCSIKEINATESREYLKNNHIQGVDNAPIRYGAFIGYSIVGVMTFSSLRKIMGRNSEENHYELSRFVSNNVTGLASKFLKKFIKDYKPEKIISYADRRWTPTHENSVYEKIGFKYIGETKPNYWYTKNFKNREYRYNYRKDVLVKLGYDSKKTESQIMDELGFVKIWDCGSLKFELDISCE